MEPGAYHGHVNYHGRVNPCLGGPRHVLIAEELSRGDASTAAGLHPRMASRVIADLLADGLVTSPSPRGPLRIAIPPHAVRYLLPTLYPEGVV